MTDFNNTFSETENFELMNKLRSVHQLLLYQTKKIFVKTAENFEQNSFAVLYLLMQKKPLSVKKISEQLQITHPAAVQIINKLLKKKYIEKYDSPSDKRVTMIKLTNEGKKAFDLFKTTADKIENSFKEIVDEVDPRFFISLKMIEEKIKSKSIVERVAEKIKDDQLKNVKIVRHKNEYKNIFRDLNLAWLNKFFEVEEEDKKALEDPEGYYLKNGGEIFFAFVDNQIAGTCAVRKTENNTFELSKMAVKENFQGKQIGKKLALTAIGYAYDEKAEKIVLETSPKLVAAFNLYKKLGFEITDEDLNSKYKRALFKMELKLK